MIAVRFQSQSGMIVVLYQNDVWLYYFVKKSLVCLILADFSE